MTARDTQIAFALVAICVYILTPLVALTMSAKECSSGLRAVIDIEKEAVYFVVSPAELGKQDQCISPASAPLCLNISQTAEAVDKVRKACLKPWNEPSSYSCLGSTEDRTSWFPGPD